MAAYFKAPYKALIYDLLYYNIIEEAVYAPLIFYIVFGSTLTTLGFVIFVCINLPPIFIPPEIILAPSIKPYLFFLKKIIFINKILKIN